MASPKPLIITGPPSSKFSREEAEAALVKHPRFPKNASYELSEVQGQWVAAVSKEAGPEEAFAPEPPAPEGPPSDEAPFEGPSDEGEDKPKDEGDGDDKKDEGKKDEKGEKGELGEIKELLTTLLTALGLNPEGQEDSPVPGLDEAAGGPPGPEAPPEPGTGNQGDNKTHTVHERALKPGEAPPGTTPIGSPSFASTHPDHPWATIVGQKRSFPLEEELRDGETIASVKAELEQLAEGTGYRVAQVVPQERDGKRYAKVLISK